MREIFTQDCPLCALKAEYYFIDYGNSKYFKCPFCTYFQITRHAEKNLCQSTQEWRDNCALKAKSTPLNYLLVITAPNSSSSDILSAVISAEFRPKSECLL